MDTFKYYWQYRDRVDKNGMSTFSDEVKEFFSAKLYETNQPYSSMKRRITNLKYDLKYDLFPKVMKKTKRIIPGRIRRVIKQLLRHT